MSAEKRKPCSARIDEHLKSVNVTSQLDFHVRVLRKLCAEIDRIDERIDSEVAELRRRLAQLEGDGK